MYTSIQKCQPCAVLHLWKRHWTHSIPQAQHYFRHVNHQPTHQLTVDWSFSFVKSSREGGSDISLSCLLTHAVIRIFIRPLVRVTDSEYSSSTESQLCMNTNTTYLCLSIRKSEWYKKSEQWQWVKYGSCPQGEYKLRLT